MARSYAHTNMYRMPAMQGAGGAGASSPKYGLKGDGTNLSGQMALDNALAIGDWDRITFRNTAAAGVAGRILKDAVTNADRGFVIQAATTNFLNFNSVAGTMKLDEVGITSGVEQYPTDGLTHTLEQTAIAAMNTGTFFSRWDGAAFSLSTILKYESNTVLRGYESWTFNNRSLTEIPNDQGTGQSIILTNVTPSDWVIVS